MAFADLPFRPTCVLGDEWFRVERGAREGWQIFRGADIPERDAHIAEKREDETGNWAYDSPRREDDATTLAHVAATRELVLPFRSHFAPEVGRGTDWNGTHLYDFYG